MQDACPSIRAGVCYRRKVQRNPYATSNLMGAHSEQSLCLINSSMVQVCANGKYFITLVLRSCLSEAQPSSHDDSHIATSSISHSPQARTSLCITAARTLSHLCLSLGCLPEVLHAIDTVNAPDICAQSGFRPHSSPETAILFHLLAHHIQNLPQDTPFLVSLPQILRGVLAAIVTTLVEAYNAGAAPATFAQPDKEEQATPTNLQRTATTNTAQADEQQDEEGKAIPSDLQRTAASYSPQADKQQDKEEGTTLADLQHTAANNTARADEQQDCEEEATRTDLQWTATNKADEVEIAARGSAGLGLSVAPFESEAGARIDCPGLSVTSHGIEAGSRPADLGLGVQSHGSEAAVRPAGSQFSAATSQHMMVNIGLHAAPDSIEILGEADALGSYSKPECKSKEAATPGVRASIVSACFEVLCCAHLISMEPQNFWKQLENCPSSQTDCVFRAGSLALIWCALVQMLGGILGSSAVQIRVFPKKPYLSRDFGGDRRHNRNTMSQAQLQIALEYGKCCHSTSTVRFAWLDLFRLCVAFARSCTAQSLSQVWRCLRLQVSCLQLDHKTRHRIRRK
jgi:hypothetical protein